MFDKKIKEILELAIPLIKKWEGFVPHPYYCPAGELTIGYGHVLRPDTLYKGMTASYYKEKTTFINDNGLLNIMPNSKIKLLFPDIITEKAAEKLLIEQLKVEFFPVIVKSITNKNLKCNQTAALLSLVYNIGARNFSNSTLVKRVNEGKLEEASSQFLKWVYVGKKINNGLKNRRAEEKQLFDKDL